MRAPVAVFAIGNRSRGDDAVASLLLDRLRAWLEAGSQLGEFELFEEYQLQVENALDLEGRRLALFIDASGRSVSPVTFREEQGRAGLAASHALEPAAVLDVFRRVAQGPAPPAFVMAVRATEFELGTGLSATASTALEAAWGALRTLAERPDPDFWRSCANAWEAPAAARGLALH